MKGKNSFTSQEINRLKKLIKERNKAESSKQKGIRSKIRKVGFYGRDDFGIVDLQLRDIENLIRTKKIIVTNVSSTKDADVKNTFKTTKKKHTPTPTSRRNFKIFDPLQDDASQIPDEAGNYIICLKDNAKLPKTDSSFETQMFHRKEVIYVGIAGKSLRKRDYRQHFNGNAGSSTLRKSIGSLFGYKKISRSKHKDDGKTKFSKTDELKLSDWMKNNLLLFYFANPSPDDLEDLLIRKFNPPLNLSKNKNQVNIEFRRHLSRLRNAKQEKPLTSD